MWMEDSLLVGRAPANAHLTECNYSPRIEDVLMAFWLSEKWKQHRAARLGPILCSVLGIIKCSGFENISVLFYCCVSSHTKRERKSKTLALACFLFWIRGSRGHSFVMALSCQGRTPQILHATKTHGRRGGHATRRQSRGRSSRKASPIQTAAFSILRPSTKHSGYFENNLNLITFTL